VHEVVSIACLNTFLARILLCLQTILPAMQAYEKAEMSILLSFLFY